MLQVIHLKETDGDVHIQTFWKIDEVLHYIDCNGLTEEDVTIIHGYKMRLSELRNS